MSRKKIVISSAVIVSVLVSAIALIAYGLLVKRAFNPIRKAETVKAFPFSEENSLREWEEKIFRGRVVYRVERNEPLSYVRASSKGTASALYYKIKMDTKGKKPVISWKWNVDKFPDKKNPEDLETINENDFAAHVYVIFPAVFFTNSKVLEYIWAKDLPEGRIGTSPYSKNIKLVVTRSGENKDRKWVHEERDIVADYMKAFGTRPEYDIGAVAFMTNAEHTGSSADAMYDEIDLGYKE